MRKDITRLNAYAPKNRALKYTKPKLMASHERDQSMIAVRDFNTLHSITDRTSRHNVHTL